MVWNENSAYIPAPGAGETGAIKDFMTNCWAAQNASSITLLKAVHVDAGNATVVPLQAKPLF